MIVSQDPAFKLNQTEDESAGTKAAGIGIADQEDPSEEHDHSANAKNT